MSSTPKAKYSSPRQQARRQRILDCARELIVSEGIDGLAMRTLADESEVALATLYNIFGDKEGVISEILKDTFVGLDTLMDQVSEIDDPLLRLQAITEKAAEVSLQSRGYSQALMVLYLNVEKRTAVHDILYKLTSAMYLDSLQGMRSKRGLQTWASIERMADDIAERFSTCLSMWLRDEIKAEQLHEYMWHGVLTVVASVSRGQLLKGVLPLLQAVTESIHRENYS